MHFLGAPPPTTEFGSFHGTQDTVRMMKRYALGPEGEQNIRVRQWAESIIRDIHPKDYLSEILAIRAWATGPPLRYTNDARHIEVVKTPYRCLLEIEKQGYTLVDCDDIGCLIAALGMAIGKEASLVRVGFTVPGSFTHVFARLKEPKSGMWIVCDPVAGPNEASMLRRVVSYDITSLDD